MTASVGTVAIIGGPLATGRRREIEQVIRTTATNARRVCRRRVRRYRRELIGIATAAAIRGLGVVIPTAIAWKTVASVLEHGKAKRGYRGIAGQPASLPEAQQRGESAPSALLLSGVTPGSPAEEAGVLVGDLLLDFDGQPVMSPEDLLESAHGRTRRARRSAARPAWRFRGDADRYAARASRGLTCASCSSASCGTRSAAAAADRGSHRRCRRVPDASGRARVRAWTPMASCSPPGPSPARRPAPNR